MANFLLGGECSNKRKRDYGVATDYTSLHMMEYLCNPHLSFLLLVSILTSGQVLSDSAFKDRFEYSEILSRVTAAHLMHENVIKEQMMKTKDWDQLLGTRQGTFLTEVDAVLAWAKSNDTVSEDCTNALRLLINAVGSQEVWAMEFLDAMGKPPSGILQFDLVWPGQYDQCVNISAKVNDTNHNNTMVNVQGKYYRLEIRLPLNLPPSMFVQTPLLAVYLKDFTYGVCMPSQCSMSDVIGVSAAANAAMSPVLPGILKNATIQGIDDPHPAVFEARPETTAALVISCLLAFFLVMGTLYDLLIHQPSLSEEADVSNVTEQTPHVNTNPQDLNATLISYSDSTESELLSYGKQISTVTIRHKIRSYATLEKFLMGFSMYTNGYKILSTETTPSQIKAVSGIRVLSLGWVILGHTYYFTASLSKNLVVAAEWAPRWTFQAVLSALFSVDSFFLLSGMLGSFLTLKEMQKRNGKINWLVYYFHRFWRLTPAYMLVLLTYIGLFHYWGDGPFWPQYAPGYDVCIKHWWRNLLYVQNFFPVTEQCIGWSWYLANDMQFFIITPLILIPLYRKPLVGYVIIGVLMMEQFLFRGLISVYYGFKMNIPDPQHQLDWFNEMYQRPYSRISPYLIGILTGYVLWRTDRKVNMSKLTVLIGWALSLTCVTSVVYGTLEENKGHLNSLQVDGIYNAMCKTVWSLGLAWIIFACNTGYGGVITEFLSSGLWGPFGRLTYCAYLIHPIMMYAFILNQRYPIYFTDINMVYMFLGHWIMSYCLAFFASLAFEAPMIGLEKVIFQRDKRH
ncbi:nose resistant to fluoxetine protein 6-like [Ylistrum balloti]|uniref:nose resistant to fluoxetine protein 6-like n=1 Tax=Ylistrum balloti TaxID=509963 RepID=UPI002905A1A5|nr:nose resistant to fluoxetine protein 6-like [Ylistrum balloti]